MTRHTTACTSSLAQQRRINMNPEFIDGGFYDPANDEPGEPLTQTDYEPLTD